MQTASTKHTSSQYLARYGVPVLILVYYVTAAGRFDYTPESTFITLSAVRNAEVNSLWMAFLAMGNTFGIDLLLAAKLLGLISCCFSILLAHLVSYELLRDHVSAFCVALAVSMQGWFLQLGPSGSGLCFVLFVTLATLFFMLRNDYTLAVVCAGLGTLVAWQVAGLMLIVLIDLSINSVNRERSRKIAVSLVMVFAASVLPWILYSLYKGIPLIPDEIAASDVPTITPEMSFATVMLVGLMFVGVVLLAARERQLLRSYTAVILWTVTVAFIHPTMLALALPLIVTFAFLAAKRIVSVVGVPRAGEIASVLLAAALLAYSQFVSRPPVYAMMDQTIFTTAEMKSAGLWLKTHMGDEESVSVPTSYAGAVQFYSDKRIGISSTTYIVSNEEDLSGFDMVFDPATAEQELQIIGQRYRVWRRQ